MERSNSSRAWTEEHLQAAALRFGRTIHHWTCGCCGHRNWTFNDNEQRCLRCFSIRGIPPCETCGLATPPLGRAQGKWYHPCCLPPATTKPATAFRVYADIEYTPIDDLV